MTERRERKDPPNIEGMFTLKVDNITLNTNESILREKFSAFGEVGDVYIPRKRGSIDNRGYAFVRFINEDDARRATDGMTGQEIDGSLIAIQDAKQPRPDNPRQAMRERDATEEVISAVVEILETEEIEIIAESVRGIVAKEITEVKEIAQEMVAMVGTEEIAIEITVTIETTMPLPAETIAATIALALLADDINGSCT
eukprot:CAMPEP_0202964364 /NCGR_PEP_ID=MMETSP1396-20130829/8439_1 /ASSEMBLY_ACC=CAM_ASM_000872 /TAXON_ID= /ORGANISM="Pseudokeronopsis sp., Strain Brazil" /LENGTH=198 /DNA_ID=CAMNT_0049686405 /DNA_START=60 /DNA_END=657 /DNA_ORIENTATION=+